MTSRLPTGLGEAIWLALSMRVGLTLFGLYVASERLIPHPCHFEEARNGWAAMPLQYQDGLAFKLVGIWERWDACWYARIASFGYTPDGSTAFFPLYPLVERIVALGGPHVVVAGMLVSFVATVAALWGLFRLVAGDHGVDTARRAVLLLAIFPAAFFLLAPFSEALFLALAIWSIERARAGDWAASAVLGALTGLARPVGIALVLPLGWLAWRSMRGGGAWSARLPVAAALAAPAATLAYLVYASAVVGRSMFDASAEWTGSAFHPPWDVLGAALDWTRRTGDPLQALQVALLLAFTALTVAGARRVAPDLTLFAVPQVAFLWLRVLPTPLTSTDRYELAIFPAFVVLALLLEGRRALWSYAIVSLLLLGALANEFVIGDFVG